MVRSLLYLPAGDHPAHAEIMRAAGARWVSGPLPSDGFRRPWPVLAGALALRKDIHSPRESTIIAESFTCGLMLGFLRHWRILPRAVRIVVMAADPGPYFLREGRLRPGTEKQLPRVDHFLTPSRMNEELLRECGVPADRISRFRVSMSPERFSELRSVTPALDAAQAVFIGHVTGAWCKGIDLMADAWRIVREKTDARLRIVGNLPDVDAALRQRLREAGVECPGPADDVLRVLSECSLYVHIGRGDAFPVAVLEAMRAGVPAIISEATGTRELIEPIAPEHVTPLDPEAIASAILNYFALPPKSKRRLSDASREATDAWDPAVTADKSAQIVREVAAG